MFNTTFVYYNNNSVQILMEVDTLLILASFPYHRITCLRKMCFVFDLGYLNVNETVPLS